MLIDQYAMQLFSAYALGYCSEAPRHSKMYCRAIYIILFVEGLSMNKTDMTDWLLVKCSLDHYQKYVCERISVD